MATLLTLVVGLSSFTMTPLMADEHGLGVEGAALDEHADVAVLQSGAGARRFGWSTVPVVVNMLPMRPGAVWYRWGPAPGPWSKALGPIVAPEGKQILSVFLAAQDGSPGSVMTHTVRSDFTLPPSRLSSAVQYTEATSVPVTGSAAVTVRVQVRTGAGTSVRRVGGRDRYDVAAAVSGGFPTADTIIIASGEKFPDALTASGLAGCLSSPLLLTKRMSLPSAVSKEIRRLGSTKAIVCGGPLSVDRSVLSQLSKMGLTVERIDGADRFEVAANTAARIATLTGDRGRVLIARGDLYPDALSLGPIAYTRKEPILLVLPGRLPAATKSALGSGYSSAGIAGGPVSVSPAVASQIAAIVGPTVRWGGADRYQAAVTIASAAVASGSNSWGYVAIAKGTDFADALTGGAGAGKAGGILLLSNPKPLSGATEKTLKAQTGEIDSVDVLGGPVSIDESTYEQIRSIFQ